MPAARPPVPPLWLCVEPMGFHVGHSHRGTHGLVASASVSANTLSFASFAPTFMHPAQAGPSLLDRMGRWSRLPSPASLRESSGSLQGVRLVRTRDVATAVPCDHLPCHFLSQRSAVPQRPRPIGQGGGAGRFADGMVYDVGFRPPRASTVPTWSMTMRATTSWQQSPRLHCAWPWAQRKELYHSMVPKEPGSLYRMNTKPQNSISRIRDTTR